MPFQITTEPFGPLPTGSAPLTEYVLEHTETGEFITVIPEYGGILRRMVLRKGHHLFALIQGPESPQELLVDESYASALLYPFPSRIRHGIYSFEGEDYALKMNEVRRDNAMHGFVHGRLFSVIKQEITAAYAQLTIRYDYTGDTAGYPFPFALTVTYTLAQANSLPNGSKLDTDRMCALRVNYSAQNTGTTRCPAAFGWHPYFMFMKDTDRTEEPIDRLSVSLPNRTPISLDDNMLPNGQHTPEKAQILTLDGTQLDSIFAIEPTGTSVDTGPFAETVLTSPDTGVRLIVGQQTGEGKLNYLVCYTPTRRGSIAIEPLTANVDAFNNGDGLSILEPWETLSGTIWVRLE